MDALSDLAKERRMSSVKVSFSDDGNTSMLELHDRALCTELLEVFDTFQQDDEIFRAKSSLGRPTE